MASSIATGDCDAKAARALGAETPALKATCASPERETLNRIMRSVRNVTAGRLDRDRVSEEEQRQDRRADGPGNPVARCIDDGIVVHVSAGGREPQSALPEQHERNRRPQ